MERPVGSGETTAYGAFRLRVLTGFAILVVSLAALLIWKIYADYYSARTVAFSKTKSFAQAMSAHVYSEVKVADLSLIRSSDALTKLAVVDRQNPERVRQILALAASVTDSSFWIHFIDVRGLGVAASNNLQVAGVSYADRLYFRSSIARCGSGLYVGAPESGRVSKRKLFFLSRPVCSTDGVPVGVVVALVDAAAIAEVFGSALFQESLSITLLHGGGKVIARAPLFAQSFSQDLTGSELYRQWKAASYGSYEGRSMVDRQTRIFSYQTVGNLPLAVAVGVATDSWTQAVRKDVTVALAALVLVLVVLAFSARYALRSFERLELSDVRQRLLIDELRDTRDSMARVAKRARMIADSLPALVSYIDADERYIFHNSFYRNVPGVDVNRMIGRTMQEALGDEIYLPVRGRVKAALQGERVIFEQPMKVGLSEWHLKHDYTPDFDDGGRVVGFYAMVIDVSKAKEIEASLSLLARVDNLTGLPNRSHLYERLGEALARSRRGGYPTAFLYLDVDHFKKINDTLGHAGGDEVLRQFGRRLRSCVRETDLVARLAGDEFVIVIEGLALPEAALTVAAKIVAAMDVPFVIDAKQYTVSTSVGLAVSSGDGDDADALLKKADQALYEAKRAGRGRFATNEFLH